MKCVVFFLLLLLSFSSAVHAQCDAANFQVTSVTQPDPCPTAGVIEVAIPGGVTCNTDNWFAILTPSTGVPVSINFPNNGGPVSFSSLGVDSYNVSVSDGLTTHAWSGNPVVLTSSYVPMAFTTSFTETSCPASSPNVVDDATLTVEVSLGTGSGPFLYVLNGGVQVFGPTMNTSHTFTGLAPGGYSVTVEDQIAAGCSVSSTQNPVISPNSRPALPSAVSAGFYKVGCPTDCDRYIIYALRDMASILTPVASNPDPNRATISINGAPPVAMTLGVLPNDFFTVFYYDGVNVGDNYVMQFTDGCDTTISSGVVNAIPSNGFIGGVVEDKANCISEFYFSAGGLGDRFCQNATVTLYEEDAFSSGGYDTLVQTPIIGLSPMNTQFGPLDPGLYYVSIDDGCSNWLDSINLVATGTTGLELLNVRESNTLLENSGSIQLVNGSLNFGLVSGLSYPLTWSVMPSNGDSTLSYVAAHPFDLAGTYNINFPVEDSIFDAQDWRATMADLPGNVSYDVTVNDNCGNTEMFQITIGEATYDPSIDVTIGCANSNAVSWNLRSPGGYIGGVFPPTDNTFAGNGGTWILGKWELYFDNGSGLPGTLVPGGYNHLNYGGEPGYKEVDLTGLASGDYVVRFNTFRRAHGGYSAALSNSSYSSTHYYHMPFTIPDYAPIGIDVVGGFCNLFDSGSGFITAEITSGTPVYPLTYELYDDMGNLIASATADSASAVNATEHAFTGLGIGVYQVLVSTPCDATSANFNLTTAALNPSANASVTELCPGGGNVTLSIPLSSAYNVVWEDDMGNVVGTGSSVDVFVSNSGTYTALVELLPSVACIVGTTYSTTVDVFVQDTVAPSAVCQDITIALNASGVANIVAADIDGGSTDNCGIASISASQTSFTCNDIGLNNVILIVTDISGNISLCTAVVTVEDNMLPVAVCQDITLALDASGNATIVASDIDGGSTDNCGIASVSASQTTFDCSNIGPNNVTLTVTDVNGNVSTCTSIVTIEDNMLPTVVCQDITLALDASGNTTIVAADIDGGSTDNCGIASVSASQTTFDCSNIGPNNVTLTVTDVNGNVSTCTSVITVEDNVLPTAICQDIILVLDISGNANIVATDIDGGSTDNCGIASISASQTAFDCSNIGPNNVTLTVTDVNGNVSTCTSTVTIEDNMLPTAVCQDITLALDASGNVTIVASDIDGGSTDNCGIASVSASQTTFDCINIGPNNVTLTVTDVNGNVSTCTSIVTIEDNMLPTAVCQDITLALDASGNTTIVAADIDGGSTDNCGIASVSASQTTFDCSNIGPNNVTLTVTDVNGNVSTCTSVITVEDNVLPTAICQDITLVLDISGNANIVAADIDGGSTDNCGIASISASQTAFDCSNIGPNNVTLTVTDVNGNVSTCTSIVSVSDTTNPIIVSCQTDSTLYATLTSCEVTLPDFTSSSSFIVTDNCSQQGVDIVVDQYPAPGLIIIQDTEVWLFAQDNSGNVDSCSFMIIVQDTVAPVIISCVQDTNLALDGDCEVTIPDFTLNTEFEVTDNCSAQGIDLTITQMPVAGTVTSENTVVSIYAVDASGNIDSCQFLIEVYDDQPPILDCLNDQDLLLNSNCVAQLPDYTNESFGLVVTDNCAQNNSDLVITQDPLPGTEISEVTEVWIIAEDAFGNVDSCMFMVFPENCQIIIYEAISPSNADGKNDEFFIEGLHLFPSSQIQIFNRWGALVYESDDYQNDWDGRSHNSLNIGGDILPEGTYYYMLTLGGDEGNELKGKVYKGFVYIKR